MCFLMYLKCWYYCLIFSGGIYAYFHCCFVWGVNTHSYPQWGNYTTSRVKHEWLIISRHFLMMYCRIYIRMPSLVWIFSTSINRSVDITVVVRYHIGPLLLALVGWYSTWIMCYSLDYRDPHFPTTGHVRTVMFWYLGNYKTAHVDNMLTTLTHSITLLTFHGRNHSEKWTAGLNVSVSITVV